MHLPSSSLLCVHDISLSVGIDRQCYSSGLAYRWIFFLYQKTVCLFRCVRFLVFLVLFSIFLKKNSRSMQCYCKVDGIEMGYQYFCTRTENPSSASTHIVYGISTSVLNGTSILQYTIQAVFEQQLVYLCKTVNRKTRHSYSCNKQVYIVLNVSDVSRVSLIYYIILYFLPLEKKNSYYFYF